jgi:hypothetical protein
MKNTHDYKPHETVINLKDGDNSFEIKTINIQ